ncbi:MAG: SufE family protein [Candidatus Thermoplasmatota archaeon]|nr:SufE family protein [Candidatus Thermoplasmatota archaeon]
MNYSAELSELIEEFQEIDDKMERLEMVFDLADEVNLLPIDQWSETTRVHGCQSEAHVKVGLVDSNVNFQAGADSKLVQGLMGILTMAIHGNSADEVLTLTPDFATEMGILNSLSPSRSNGFRNMFDKVMNEIKQQM